jgi:tRNA U34 2-thiouridine synthase MnmA/TrmU
LSFKAYGTNHLSLYHDEFYVDEPHWIGENPEKGLEDILGSSVNFRFQQRHKEAEILYLKKIKEFDRVRYLMKTKYPFRGITPGQFVVFYKNEECLGSAKIIETPLSLFDLKYKSSIVNTDQLLKKDYLIKKI